MNACLLESNYFVYFVATGGCTLVSVYILLHNKEFVFHLGYLLEFGMRNNLVGSLEGIYVVFLSLNLIGPLGHTLNMWAVSLGQ